MIPQVRGSSTKGLFMYAIICSQASLLLHWPGVRSDRIFSSLMSLPRFFLQHALFHSYLLACQLRATGDTTHHQILDVGGLIWFMDNLLINVVGVRLVTKHGREE
jgi:hypothetical protein